MRLFCALSIDEAVKAAAAAVQTRLAAELGRGARGLKPVRPDGFHFTLAFIGEVDDATAARVVEAAAEAARTVPPFVLQLRGAGCFPSPKRPRVFWMGATGETFVAVQLAAAVAEALEARKVPFDPKPFKPHLTLARVGDPAAFAGLDVPAALARLAGEHAPEQRFAELRVMRSHLSPKGSTYEALATFPLSG